MERIPILANGRLLAGDDPGGHARPAGNGAAGRPDANDQPDRGARGVDRHFQPGNRGFVHRPDAGQYRGHVAGAGRRNRSGRNAAGGGYHAGGTGAFPARGPNGFKR